MRRRRLFFPTAVLFSSIFVAFPAVSRGDITTSKPVKSKFTKSAGGSRSRTDFFDKPKSATLPRVFAPMRVRKTTKGAPVYPWRNKIFTTVFWVGEAPTQGNPTPNHVSSWDTRWVHNYGGYDDPRRVNRGWDFSPKGFAPGLNPFYIALPYNDVLRAGRTKSEAAKVVPWFKSRFRKQGHTVLRGQWVAIRHGGKTCYAQWEDCGPFETSDWMYVFGKARPRNRNNNGAGLDVSPAVRDFLGMGSGAHCDWRFMDIRHVPRGPWRKYGSNNHFVRAQGAESQRARERYAQLRRDREAWTQRAAQPSTSGRLPTVRAARTPKKRSSVADQSSRKSLPRKSRS